MNSKQRIARECDCYEKALEREYQHTLEIERASNASALLGGWTVCIIWVAFTLVCYLIGA
jgi:hypothetical protein